MIGKHRLIRRAFFASANRGERLPGDGGYLLVDRNEMHTYLLRLTADKSEIFDGEVWKLFDDAFASTLSLSPTSAYLFYP